MRKRENKKELPVAFMELEKAYGKICREEQWMVLYENGVNE